MSLFILLFFFFKQKTAYEMRISDWSSDVCSSDLLDPADFRGDLADQLLIRARDLDRGGLFHLDLDTGRDRIDHFMAEAHVQLQVLALHRRTQTDAVDFQFLGEAVLDALHQVIHQGTLHAPPGAAATRGFPRLDGDLAVPHQTGRASWRERGL